MGVLETTLSCDDSLEGLTELREAVTVCYRGRMQIEGGKDKGVPSHGLVAKALNCLCDDV